MEEFRRKKKRTIKKKNKQTEEKAKRKNNYLYLSDQLLLYKYVNTKKREDKSNIIDQMNEFTLNFSLVNVLESSCSVNIRWPMIPSRDQGQDDDRRQKTKRNDD